LGTGTFFDGFDAISLAAVLSIVVSTFNISFAEAGLIISAGYVGQFIGAICIGLLADRFGRKKALIGAIMIFALLSVACAFAWSSTSLLVFRLIQGLGLGAEVPIAGTLINEYLGRKSRGRVAVLYQSAFSWGLFFAPLVALALTSYMGPQLAWRVLLGIGVLPLFVAIWAWFALPESARWLAERGRHQEADAYVRQMEAEAASQGKVLDEPAPLPATAHKTFTASELFSGQYGRRTVMMGLLWFSAYFVIYGYSVWLPSLYVKVGHLPPANSLLLTVLIGIIVIAVVNVIASLVEKIGRKPALFLGFAVATAAGVYGLVMTTLFGDTSWQVLFTTGCLIALGISVPAAVLYMYTAEIYPTRMRGFATSSASSLARLASVLSPFLIGPLLDSGGVGTIFALVGGFSLLGALVIGTVGIETRNRSLEDISA
jgi:putative MFS transporter